MINWKREEWNTDAIEDFAPYFDAKTLMQIVDDCLLVGVFNGMKRIGSFTYQTAKTFTGNKIIEIRHLAGKFAIDLMYPILKQLGSMENAIVRVVSDRKGFDKVLNDYNFKKITTVWELA